ncbi:uncharacterized protein PRCAT00003641001 [Priceomyces carsonii]|uniref:uncharacterized protein n=1 Tax=Priceomyces carsonii TaxID=28549 RepID=UPI002EDB5BF3|nr:unnamed protein product [Priceomyces carsonii]
MVDRNLIEVYLKYAWTLVSQVTTSERQFELFRKKYGQHIEHAITFSQVTTINLVISLYYLHKYKENYINRLDKEDISIVAYLVIVSLILSNKALDDLCYTLKTWIGILTQQSGVVEAITLDLKLLNQLESHFLHVLDYKLSFALIDTDDKFWNIMKIYAGRISVSDQVFIHLKSQVSNSCSLPECYTMAGALVSAVSTFLNVPKFNYYCTPLLSCTTSPVIPSSSHSMPAYSPLTPATPYSMQFTNPLKKRKPNRHSGSFTHSTYSGYTNTFSGQSYLSY